MREGETGREGVARIRKRRGKVEFTSEKEGFCGTPPAGKAGIGYGRKGGFVRKPLKKGAEWETSPPAIGKGRGRGVRKSRLV